MKTNFKRYIAAAVLICTVFCLVLLSACHRWDKKAAKLPDVFPLEMTFSSGAGAWRTKITLNRDGSFEGEHYDSDGGDRSEAYPQGTVYICNFSGQFENIQKVDGHTYSMTLGEIKTEKEEGEEWLEGEIRHIVSIPYGLEDGSEFLFYTPNTPLEGISEEFLSWWPDWYYADSEGKRADRLSCYGLYNVEMEYGFFTY